MTGKKGRKLLLLGALLGLLLGVSAQAREWEVDPPVLDAWEAYGARETGLTMFVEEGPYILLGSVVEGWTQDYYGLKDSAGNVIFPAKYDDIAYAGNNRVILNRSELVDLSGKILWQKKGSSIKYIKQADVFLIGGSYLLDGNLKEIKGSTYYQLEHLAGKGFLVKDRNYMEGLYIVGKGLVAPCEYQIVHTVVMQGWDNDKPLFQTIGENYRGLYDSEGRRILPDEYVWFEGNYGSLLIVEKLKRPEYIEDYRRNGSWSKENNEYMRLRGIVDVETGEIILPVIYDGVTFAANGDVTASIYTGINWVSSGTSIGGVPNMYAVYDKQSTTISLSELLANRPKYKDVPAGSWYFDAVQWAADEGMLETSGGHLYPLENASRAEVVKYLWRAAGSPKASVSNPFTDISASDSFYQAALWAYENGITTGTGDGTTFTPGGTCTRSQVVTFLWRVKGQPEITYRDQFADVAQDTWYTLPVAWAVDQKVTTGTSDTTFTPDGTCSRAEILTFVYRAAGK